jgi:hypothetical protein
MGNISMPVLLQYAKDPVSRSQHSDEEEPMEKSTPVIQSTNNLKSNDNQVLAHFAIVSFALFGFGLNLFSQMWGSVKQLGAIPGNLFSRPAEWIRQKMSDMGLSIWQERESNS